MTRYGLMLLSSAKVLGLGACDDESVIAPSLAQTFEVTVENVSTVYDFSGSGFFDTPAGDVSPGPLLPGGVYEFDFSAAPGSRLSFATMFVQSNDWFYAPDGAGIALWDVAGNQLDGDVTDQLYLWDAGTEEDQEPGLGADQAPRQAGADVGASDDDAAVRLAEDAWSNIPDAVEVLEVTLIADGGSSFRTRIENVSDATTLSTSDGMTHPVPLAPGVWAVHTGTDPLFAAGQVDRGDGLGALAEDGDAASLSAAVAASTGLTGPIAPGAFAVHRAPSALFMAGMPDTGAGLEALAEDGDPSGLVSALAANPGAGMSGAFDTPVGGAAPAAAFPGESYTFEFTAEPGDRLSFATMLVQSNDLFYAPAETGIDLFPNGTAASGDLTGMVLLWDAGTEVNEEPGVGLYQAPRQSGPDTGPSEDGVIRQANDGYAYPGVDEVVQVSIRVVG